MIHVSNIIISSRERFHGDINTSTSHWKKSNDGFNHFAMGRLSEVSRGTSIRLCWLSYTLPPRVAFVATCNRARFDGRYNSSVDTLTSRSMCKRTTKIKHNTRAVPWTHDARVHRDDKVNEDVLKKLVPVEGFLQSQQNKPALRNHAMVQGDKGVQAKSETPAKWWCCIENL